MTELVVGGRTSTRSGRNSLRRGYNAFSECENELSNSFIAPTLTCLIIA